MQIRIHDPATGKHQVFNVRPFDQLTVADWYTITNPPIAEGVSEMDATSNTSAPPTWTQRFGSRCEPGRRTRGCCGGARRRRPPTCCPSGGDGWCAWAKR